MYYGGVRAAATETKKTADEAAKIPYWKEVALDGRKEECSRRAAR